MKITTRCGPETIEQLNAALVAKAVEAGVVDMGWLRADTTVVPADINLPPLPRQRTRPLEYVGGEAPMTDELRARIRRRLVKIADELLALPAQDFAGKHSLNTEADALRRQLSELGDSDPDTLRQWAERAARKGSHAVDDEVEAAKAAIVSPIKSNGTS